MARNEPPWSRPPRNKDQVHSPAGVEQLRSEVKYGLTRFYTGIAESMWRWEFPEGFEDMRTMSRGIVPEKFLFKNGSCCVFELPGTGQYHILPLVMDKNGINIYGNPAGWSPVPVGWVQGTNTIMDSIRNLKLNDENSVIIMNDLFGGNDASFIDAMVNELVDNVLTLNQLQLIAKCPFVFNVEQDNLLTAKQFFLSMCQDKPAIFINSRGDKPMPVIESTQMQIDPALFEIFDRFECLILTYIGFPCVPITKRAQQTVSEVQSNDAKLYARRMEKWNQRKRACERMEKVFGIHVECISIIDEDISEQAEAVAEGDEDGGADDE